MNPFIDLIQNTDGSFNVQNENRDIHYKIIIGKETTYLSSSVCPEYTGEYTLFLQGEGVALDNTTVNISRPNIKFILYAIYTHNMQLVTHTPFDYANILKHKFKCKTCNKNKPVSEFSQKYFDYCVDCAESLHACTSCESTCAEFKFGDNYFCTYCCSKNAYCQVCEKVDKITVHKTYIVPEDYHGDVKYITTCQDCYVKDLKSELGKEHHYHYSPLQFNFWDYDFRKKKRTRLKEAPNNKLFMGVEVEAQFQQQKHTNIVIGKILKIYGEQKEDLLYAKHDGTVPDPGSELVTHPMTLNMFRSLTWKGLFDNIIKPTTHDIGGHIHINKNAFTSPLHVYKFTKFLRTNIKYVEWISERNLREEWCKPRSRNGKAVYIAKRFQTTVNADRYEMVNFTDYTIELRFFWSPSSTAMLLKNVEFVDALYNFTKNGTLHFNQATFEDYIDKNSILYPYLYNFIYTRQIKGIIPNIFSTNPEYLPYGNCTYDSVECNTACGSSEPEEEEEAEDDRDYCPYCHELLNNCCCDNENDNEVEEEYS